MKAKYAITLFILCALAEATVYGASKNHRNNTLTVPKAPCNTPFEKPATPPSPQSSFASSALAHLQSKYHVSHNGTLEPLTITVEPPARPAQ